MSRRLWDEHPELRKELKKVATASKDLPGHRVDESLDQAIEDETQLVQDDQDEGGVEAPRKTIRRLRKEHKRQQYHRTAGIGTDDYDRHVGEQGNDDVYELSEDSDEDLFNVDDDDSTDDDTIVPREDRHRW